MAIKVVLVFQQVTDAGVSDPNLGLAGRNHIAGFSESLIWDGGSTSNLITALTQGFGNAPALLPARAGFLTDNASIIGVRLYEGGSGRGSFRALSSPGTGGKGDIPQMALLGYMPLQGITRARRFIWRGLPDAAVIGGEFSGDFAIRNAIVNYGAALANFSAYGTGNPTAYRILAIDNLGIVTLDNMRVVPWAVGTTVQFSRVVNAAGNNVSANYNITALGPFPFQFTVAGWAHGVCSGGTVREKPNSSLFAMVGAPTVSRVVPRKVGRPFELYRGRRSKRRRR